MPLSKVRDRARKQAERDKIRLEGKKIQPTDQYLLSAIQFLDDAPVDTTFRPQIDADGNSVYEE